MNNLKDAIVIKRAPEFNTFAAARLTLYDEQKAIEAVNTLTIPARLNPGRKLNEVFPSGPSDHRISILVRVPEGESFSPRPGHDVADDSLTAPFIPR